MVEKPEKPSALSLLKIGGVSWSLLTSSEKILFALRVCSRIALNGLDIIAVGLMGLLGAITATGLSGQNIEIFGVFLPEASAGNVITLVAVVAALFLLKGGLGILLARWTAVFLAGIETKNSAKVARYVFSGSLQRLRKFSRAEVQFLVTVSVSATFSGVLGATTTLLIEGALFVGIFAVFLIVDWLSALAIAAYFAGLIYVLQLTTAKRYLQSGRRIQEGTVGVGSAILEMVDGFREMAVLSKQSFFLSRFVEAKKLAARTAVALQILKSIPRFIAEGGLILGALGFVVWQLTRGSLAEGLLSLGIFLSGSFRMMGAVLPLQQLWNEVRVSQRWVTSAQEVLLKLKETPELLDASIYAPTNFQSKKASSEARAGLEVRLDEVSFRHLGAPSQTIDQITLQAPAGSYSAIVGPSGAGKTTLVDLILGLYQPDSGTVAIDGFEPQAFREDSPGLLAYVPQKPGVVTGSIADNVALGLAEHERDEEQIWAALQGAQLADHVRTLERTIHSDLGSHSDALSGGQIQRLGLARALYSKPNLIILDEATSALDAATEASISGAIQQLGSGTTVIVIAHRLSTIQHADIVHVMDQGRIVDSGSFKEVRRRVPMIEEYVRLMSFDD